MGNEPSEDSRDGNRKEEHTEQSVREMLEYLESQVTHGRDMGVDFSEVEGMITGARIIIESGEVSDAAEIISECMQRASARFSDFETLSLGIRKVEMEIQAAHTAGRDVTEAGTQLRMSRIHMERGEYRLGIEAIKHVIQALAEPKPAEVVWGSGLEAE